MATVCVPPEPRGQGRRQSHVRRVTLLVSALLSAAACGGPLPGSQPPTAGPGTGSATTLSTGPPITTAAPPTTPVASQATPTVWQLRFRLLDHYRDFAYCDPDLYPIARDDQQAAADDWWARADHGSSEVAAILAERSYREPLTPAQRLVAYGDHKKSTVIVMRPISVGYEYELSIGKPGSEPDQTVVGVISSAGRINERSRRPRPGGCPICLEAGTRIATPAGEVLVANVQAGDVVWTTDAAGRRISAAVVRLERRPTPGPHLMLRLSLNDGRVLIAAGAHPAAGGRYLGHLRPGWRYDGATVSSVEWISSTAPSTFDLLPAGPTGAYWANGVLVGSTLASPAP